MNLQPGIGERLNPPSRGYGATSRPLERLTPNPKLKFMEQCREVMRFHRLALRTEEAYLQWIKRFLVFHRDRPRACPTDQALTRPAATFSHPMGEGQGWRRPEEMGEKEVEAFLTHLAADEGGGQHAKSGVGGVDVHVSKGAGAGVGVDGGV